jgi:hypothetical protein
VERKPMSEALNEKLAALAAAIPRLVQGVTERTDALVRRVEGTEQKTIAVFAAKHAQIDKLEAGVALVDKALDQISNGGPPLDGSTPQSGGSGG